MSNTKIQKILMDEIEAVNKDKNIDHVDKAKCFNRLVNVYNRTTTNNLRAINLAHKIGDFSVTDVSKLLKRPELK